MTERMLVVAAIIVDDLVAPTRVLAARRTGPLSGWWEFPGGKVESGEMPEPIDSHDELRWLDAGSLRSVAWLDADLVVVPYVFALVKDARQRAGDLASARNSTDLDYLAGN